MYVYEVPCMKRVQVAIEGSFAASRSMADNSPSGVAVDTWTKFGGTDADTWSD